MLHETGMVVYGVLASDDFMFKKLHEKAEPWLTFIDWIILKPGLGVWLMGGIPGIGIGVFAWIEQAPLYIIFLAAILAVGAALFVANQSVRLVGAWKVPSGISRQQARRMDREDP